MSAQFQSTREAAVQISLDGTQQDGLNAFLKQRAAEQVESRGWNPVNYDLYAVRRDGTELHGPKNIRVDSYSAEQLYGNLQSPVPRFKAAIAHLAANADRIARMDTGAADYDYEATLFWADTARLKEFIGCHPVVSGIVAELLTAHFQVRGTETPPALLGAISAALREAVDARHWSPAVVDRLVDRMEAGGFDTFAPERLRAGHE